MTEREIILPMAILRLLIRRTEAAELLDGFVESARIDIHASSTSARGMIQRSGVVVVAAPATH